MPTRSRLRAVRALAAAALAASLLVPAAVPASAQEKLILRAGTDQKTETLNPWHAVTVADYEIFTLNYDLLVGFGIDLEPAPGFADRWESSADAMTHTFHIREGMAWSDGTPATCEDARWTYQLVLDAVNSEAGYLGSGYLEPYLTNAGLSAVSCSDPNTLVVQTAFPTTLLTQAYVPILPKHIWSTYTLDQIGNAEADGFFLNEPTVVGTGPYQAVEWQPGEFIRFERNPTYWGAQGAAEEVIVQTFASTDTMVQALRSGEIDYVRGVSPDQFDFLGGRANIQTVEGFSNGYTYLAFNTGGTQNGYNASTDAFTDPLFRDALGYAIDKQVLVDRTLAGHGVVGDTNVPPYHANWHVPPDRPRSFDIEEAKRRLDAAGYALDASGKRLDKAGNPITIRITWPDSEAEEATNAQFLQGWWGELGIAVDAYVTEEGKLLDDLLGPDADGTADWDTFLWGWIGDPDPMSLLSFFVSDQLGGLNDSFFRDARYDELFELQQQATDEADRKQFIAEMQQIVYDQAPYHILYYDNELHAYRTDKFANWTSQPPDSGTPLFGYGPVGYTLLADANAPTPTPEPTAAPTGAPVASPTPSPSGDGGGGGGGGGDTTLIIVGVVAVVIVVAAGLVLARRRSAGAEEED